MSTAAHGGRGFSICGPEEGQIVVFLHGVFFGRGTWAPQVDRLADRYRVVSIDLPGHGDLVDVAYTLASASAWVAEVLDANTHGPVVIVGLSLGGLTSMELSRRRPDLFRALVLTGASMEPRSFLRLGVRRIARLLQHAPRGLSGRIAVLAIRVLYGREVAAVIRKSGPSIPSGMAALSILPDGGFRDALAQLEAPVLILNGAADWLVRGQQAAFAAACRDGTLVTVPGAGHLLPIEKPNDFAESLAQFVEGLPRASAS